jgi:hypothetical protein
MVERARALPEGLWSSGRQHRPGAREEETRGGDEPRDGACTSRRSVRQVISDFRAPDVIRLRLSPLRSTFVDVLAGVGALRALLLE